MDFKSNDSKSIILANPASVTLPAYMQHKLTTLLVIIPNSVVPKPGEKIDIILEYSKHSIYNNIEVGGGGWGWRLEL
jgi:hypothetical protein